VQGDSMGCGSGLPMGPPMEKPDGRKFFALKFSERDAGSRRAAFRRASIGQKIFDNVSKEAWKDVDRAHEMLMNEYRLNLATTRIARSSSSNRWTITSSEQVPRCRRTSWRAKSEVVSALNRKFAENLKAQSRVCAAQRLLDCFRRLSSRKDEPEIARSFPAAVPWSGRLSL